MSKHDAAGLTRKAFPDADNKRVKGIAEGAWAADAVAKTIAGIHAVAITVATTSAVIVTTT